MFTYLSLIHTIQTNEVNYCLRREGPTQIVFTQLESSLVQLEASSLIFAQEENNFELTFFILDSFDNYRGFDFTFDTVYSHIQLVRCRLLFLFLRRQWQ